MPSAADTYFAARKTLENDIRAALDRFRRATGACPYEVDVEIGAITSLEKDRAEYHLTGVRVKVEA